MKLVANPLPLVRKKNGELWREMAVEVHCLRAEDEINQYSVEICTAEAIRRQGGLNWQRQAEGEYLARVLVPANPWTTVECSVSLVNRRGEKAARVKTIMRPVKKWNIYVVTHSHCDIGFTHPASEVAAIHTKNTDLALAAIEATREWEANSRFRWTVENAWQLEQYRSARGAASVQRVIEAARRGDLEITAVYHHNHFDILGSNQIKRITWEAEWWASQGAPLQTAMISDIPGVSWGILPVLQHAGIRYLVMAPNNFAAPFHKFDPPERPFYWQGPGGEKVMVWYTGDPRWAYIEGARYGLLESVEQAALGLPMLLQNLEQQGYCFDLLMLQVAFDNDRLQILPAQIVKEWNRVYAWPKLRTAVPAQFFENMEDRYGDQLPIYKGDWPSWWVTSTTAYVKEAAMSRQAHRELDLVENMAVLAHDVNEAYLFPSTDMEQVYKDLLAFDEHSGLGGIWIAFDQDKQQQALREGLGFLQRPLKELPRLKQEALAALLEKMPNPDQPSIVALNLAPRERSGLVQLSCDETGFALAEGLGWQRVGDSYLGTAENVPALGYKKLCRVTPSDPVYDGAAGVLKNRFYEMEFGTDVPLANILDLETGQRLVCHDEEVFASVLAYAENPLAHDNWDGNFQALADRYEGIPRGGTIVERWPAPAKSLTLEQLWNGAHVTVVRKQLKDRGLELTWDFWLYHSIKRIDFVVTLRNTQEIERAGTIFYLALPFIGRDCQVHHSVPGGLSKPGGDGQLPGSCMDTYAVGDWVHLSGGKRGDVVVSSHEAALIDYDGINYNRFIHGSWRPKKGLLMCRLVEGNYRGELSFRFSITSGKSLSLPAAHNFAEDVHNPMLAAYLPQRKKVQNEWQENGKGFVHVTNPNVTVAYLTKTEEPGTFLFWLQELGGELSRTRLEFPNHTLIKAGACTPAGRLLEPLAPTTEFTLGPYQTRILKVVLFR